MTQKQNIFSLFFMASLALAPLIALETPRFLAYGPPLIGLIGMGLFVPVYGFRPAFSKSVFIVAGLILLLAGASAVWAIDPAIVPERVLKLAPLMICGALLVSFCQSVRVENIRPYGWMFPVFFSLAAFLVSLELWLDAPFYRFLRDLDSLAPVRDAVFNRCAVTCVILFFSCLAFIQNLSHKNIFYTVIALAAALMIFSIESQSAQLGFILGILTLFLFPYRTKAAWVLLGSLIACLIFAAPLLAPWLFENFAEKLNALPFLGVEQGYAGARLEIWDYISRHLLQNPWTGYGIEAARSIEFDSAEIYQKGKTILHPHNFAIQAWLEFGVIGAAAASALCIYIIHAIYKNLDYAQQRIALPVFITVFAIASTSYGMWQGWWIGMLFLVTACCILAIRFISTEKR